jgi:hypothetical protein
LFKKTSHALLQIVLFFSMFLKADGKLDVRIVECGWPDSRWKSRFLVIGSLHLHESQIFTKVENKLFSLQDSPQRQFFQNLDQRGDFSNLYYYKVARQILNDENFAFWLRTKTRLWEEFNVDSGEFTPVGILKFNHHLIVEDGAHRLALRSLRGIQNHRVDISVWSFA